MARVTCTARGASLLSNVAGGPRWRMTSLIIVTLCIGSAKCGTESTGNEPAAVASDAGVDVICYAAAAHVPVPCPDAGDE